MIMKIRLANIDDLPAIDEIYNQAISMQMATADTEPYSKEERLEWFMNHDPGKSPVFIGEYEGKLVAYLTFSPYRPRREAMRFTSEISYFVHKDFLRLGFGSAFMKYAIARATDYGVKTFIAILLAHNEASIALLQKYGFEEWGLMPRVADFNGVERDHLYYGLKL